VTLWTVIQRDKYAETARDLAPFFNPLDEAEARSLAERLRAMNRVRCQYIARPA